MEITEVRIKLMDGVQDRLLGFCSITFDRAFVVRDLKIIKGSRGAFVAMPSRKLTDRCRNCHHKNPLRSAYCSQCGQKLPQHRSGKTNEGKSKLYADIAHPINSECRDLIQQKVMAAYEEEILLAQQPGYVCRYDDFGEFDMDHDEHDRWDEEFAMKEATLTPERWDELHPPEEPSSQIDTDASEQEDQDPSMEDRLVPARKNSPKNPSSPRGEGFGEGVL